LWVRGIKTAAAYAIIHNRRGSQEPRILHGKCRLLIDKNNLYWGCRPHEQEVPSAAQRFLLLRFLCRYKENEVAVGQPRRFWFCLL